MFKPTIVPGGMGQADVDTAAYSCSGGVCRAKDAENAGVFAGLQRQINAMLRLFNQGFQINEDGIIGKQTVDAGSLVLSLQSRQAGSGAAWFAENARRLAGEFAKQSRIAPDFRPPTAAASGTTLSPTRPPPIAPAPPPQVLTPPPTPDQVQELAPTPDGKKKGLLGVHWAWWTIGGALLVGAGYVGYRYFFKKKKGGGVSGADDHGYGEAVDDFIDV